MFRGYKSALSSKASIDSGAASYEECMASSKSGIGRKLTLSVISGGLLKLLPSLRTLSINPCEPIPVGSLTMQGRVAGRESPAL